MVMSHMLLIYWHCFKYAAPLVCAKDAATLSWLLALNARDKESSEKTCFLTLMLWMISLSHLVVTQGRDLCLVKIAGPEDTLAARNAPRHLNLDTILFLIIFLSYIDLTSIKLRCALKGFYCSCFYFSSIYDVMNLNHFFIII